MRIACVQFAPQVGDVDNNLNRADSVLSKANPQDLDNLDLLVLPEMAFSGYNFETLGQITPFLEHAGSGISSLWARTSALKYGCTVVVGYPEKVDVGDRWPSSPEYYNSAIMVSSEGETIANYRKSHLYTTDERWALEGGDGFFTGYVPGLGYTAMGICMDLNPYKFEAPWHAYEFAFHALDVEANVVILSMAWITNQEASSFSRTPQEPDVETLTYWVQRLEPIIRAEQEDEIIVIFCNRTGIEGDAVYAGTSAVLGIYHGEVNLYGILGRGVKEVLVIDTENTPKAKLINESDDQPIGGIPMRRMLSPIDPNTIAEASPGNETSPASGSKADPDLNAETPHSAAPGGWSAVGGTPVATPTSSGSSKSQRVKPPSIRIPVATSMWKELPKEVIKEDPEERQEPHVHTPTGSSPTPLDLRPDGGGGKPSEWSWTPSSAHVGSPLALRSATPASGGFRGRTKHTFGLITPDTPSIQKPLSSGKSSSSASIWQELAVALCTPPEDNFVPGITDTPGILDTPGLGFPAPPSAKSSIFSARSRTSSRTRSSSINEGSLNHPPKSSSLIRTKDRMTGIEHASPISRPMSTDPYARPGSTDPRLPDRPASPKSRNASRSRPSAPTDPILPDRPASPKSRNASRSRPRRRSDSVTPDASVVKRSGESMTPMQRLDALITKAGADVNGAQPPDHERGRDSKGHRRHRSQETTQRSRKEDFSYPQSAFPRSDAPHSAFPFPFPHSSASGDVRVGSPGDMFGTFIPLIASPSIFETASQISQKSQSQRSESHRSERSDSQRSESLKSESRRSERREKLRAEQKLTAERLAAFGLSSSRCDSRSSQRSTQERDPRSPPEVDKQRHRRNRSISVAETVRAIPRHQTPPIQVRRGPSLLSGDDDDPRSRSVIRIPKQAPPAMPPPPERPASASSHSRGVSRGRQRSVNHASATGPIAPQTHLPHQTAPTQHHLPPQDDEAVRRRRNKLRSASMSESSSKVPDLAAPGLIRSRSRPNQPQLPALQTGDDIIATVERLHSGCPRHGQKRSRSSAANTPINSTVGSNNAGDVVNVTLRVQLPAGLVDSGSGAAGQVMSRQDSERGGTPKSQAKSSSRTNEAKMALFNPPTPKALENFSFSMPTMGPKGKLGDLEISCEIQRPNAGVMT